MIKEILEREISDFIDIKLGNYYSVIYKNSDGSYTLCGTAPAREKFKNDLIELIYRIKIG